MKKLSGILFIFCCCCLKAQQLPQYTQFTFSKYALNPAAGGTSLKSPYEFVIGTRRQWLDISNAPKTNFFTANYTFIPKRSYRKWHNIGVLIDQDQSGVYVSNSLYAGYTFHLLVTNKLVASFGVFAGVRRFFISLNALNRDDPAVIKSANEVVAYPDVIPGFRLYNKKFFFDVSIRQLTTPQQANSFKQIGSPSKIVPHIYASIGRRFYFGSSYFSLAPSLNMLTTFTYLPSFEGNLMLHYSDRLAIGASIRGKNFIGGILQLKILKNMYLGAAYDYSINRVHIAAPNSIEFMLGILPISDSKEKRGRSSNVAKCPALAF